VPSKIACVCAEIELGFLRFYDPDVFAGLGLAYSFLF
jgi:hypothetical protein